MRHSKDELRLFVAVYPPPELAVRLLGLLPTLSLPEHRPTAVDQLHMTVQFVGNTRRNRLGSVRESVERSASGLPGFTLRPAHLIAIPDRGPIRLVAVQTDAPPPLLELHRRLATRLAHKSNPEKPDRFVPHITLARFPEGTKPLPETVTARDPWKALDAAAFPPFTVRRIELVQSVLTRSGALHESVGGADLEAD